MTAADVGAVGGLLDDAFIARMADLTGRTVPRPMFELGGLRQRLENDPEGCFVAVDGAHMLGAMFSIVRGTLAWFGPVGVALDAQGRGVGQALVAECIERWNRRDVKLMALETFPTSPFHLHLYSKFGFQPGWTGVEFRKTLGSPAPGAALPDAGAALPALDYLYPGLDVSREAAVLRERESGMVLVAGDGVLLLHLRDGLHARDTSAFVAFLAAPDRATFIRLIGRAEEAAAAAGKTEIGVRLSGSSWTAFEALVATGFRPGSAVLRMKRGANLDFDRDAWYCDDWL